MTIDDVIKKINSAAGIYGILVLDDKNNYESQWSDRLVLVDIYCRITIGIHKMRLILIPRGMDTTATLGMAALSVIIGALIGCIMIPVYVIRAVYVILRYIIGK